ncbi:retrovirus-related pol polyprotein from transposon TNT 1-94 [Tanacetum coccineum]
MRVASVNGKKYILIIVDHYSRFTWVKCLRSKDEAPNFIIKFLKMIQVRLKLPVWRIRTDNGTEFVNQTLRECYEKVGISRETSVARSPQKNEAVATACYTQNHFIIRLCQGKTPYELLHDKLPDLSFFHVFGALCYPINDSENLGKLQPKADIDLDELTAMVSEHSSSGPALHEMTPAIISSGLVPNPPPLTPFVPPSRTDWDILFQPLFDELLTPPPIAPSPSNSQTTPETQSPIIPNDVEEENHDLDVTHMNNDLFFGIPIQENVSEASSSSGVIPTVVHWKRRCTCESCGNGAHYGYNCPPKVLTISNPEPCHNQDVDELPQTLPSFDPTCHSGDESSFTYDSTPNFVDDSPNIKDYHNERIDIQCRRECEIKIYELKQNFNGMSIEIRKKGKELLQQEQAAYVRTSQRFNFICYDDDEDEYSFATQEYLKKFSSAITPDLPKSNSLVMEDKHLDTIPEPKSDELIKSIIKDLVHTPSESDGISESEYDLPVCDDSSPKKDEVLDDIISIPPGNGNDHFNAESSLIESVLNRDNVISSPKIDFLLEEFAGELALIAPIPPGIVEADFDPKGDIRFIENLMYDNSFPRPPETLKDDSETVIDSNNDYSSSDDDSPYSEDIDYVDALPPDPELVSLEVVGNVVQEDGEIDTDILLTIKDDILREKLLKVNLLIAKIEALKDNPTPSSDFVTKSSSTSLNFFLEETNTFDNSLPESETFCFNLEEISSGSPTSYLDLSLLDYEALFCDSEPDSGNFTMDVVEDIFDNPIREPRVHVPIVLPTHPTLQLDSDFTLSSDSLGSDLVVSFPFGTRNNIFNPGIFIEVQSKRFLSPNEFSISFIHDPLSPVFDTLLPFSSKNEDNVLNPGILASNEEKSPHLLSH